MFLKGLLEDGDGFLVRNMGMFFGDIKKKKNVFLGRIGLVMFGCGLIVLYPVC